MPTLKPGDKAPAFTLVDQNAVNKPGPLDILPEVKGDREPVMRERLGALLRISTAGGAVQPSGWAALRAIWWPLPPRRISGDWYSPPPGLPGRFENLTVDPRVSMLIDNRSNQISDFQEAMAVTAEGRVKEAFGKAEKPDS